MQVLNGDIVALRGFEPTNPMKHYEGAKGMVTSQGEINNSYGQLVFVQLLDGTNRLIQVNTRFLEKE